MLSSSFAGDSVVLPIRVLILLSNPLVDGTDSPIEELLDLDSEVEAIRAVLMHTGLETEIHLRVGTTHELQLYLSTTPLPFDVLHFSGHGTSPDDGASLVFEDEQGGSRFVDGETLDAAFAPLAGSSLPCTVAVLNACHSAALEAALLRAGVPHIVAVNAEVGIWDTAAREFSRHFYPALLASLTVQQAFDHACAAVSTAFPEGGADQAARYRLLPEGSPHETQLSSGTRGPVTVLPAWQDTNLLKIGAPSLVGRNGVVWQINRDLAAVRVVHLHGFGGIGKSVISELAGRWRHVRQRHDAGVWHVHLRGAAAVSEVRARIAAELGLQPGIASSDTALSTALSGSARLLLLDDLDEVLTQDGIGMARLLMRLSGTSEVKVITTSRRRLPSQVPHRTHTINRLGAEAACLVFEENALPAEEWGEASGLEELLELLDGYPLALRLAGAHMRARRLDIDTLLARLKGRPMATLEDPGGAGDIHDSVRVTLDASYEILNSLDQTALQRLGTLPGGIRRDVASQVIGSEVTERLEDLLRWSVVDVTGSGVADRFTMPEPVRQYIIDKTSVEVRDDVLQSMLHWSAQSFSRGEAGFGREGNHAFLQQVAEEYSNVRQVLDWASTRQKTAPLESLPLLVASLENHWLLSGAWNDEEVYRWIEVARREARRQQSLLLEGRLDRLEGHLRSFRPQDELSQVRLESAVRLSDAAGNVTDAAAARTMLAERFMRQGEYGRALQIAEEVVGNMFGQNDLLTFANAVLLLSEIQLVSGRHEAFLATLPWAKRAYQQLHQLTGLRNALCLSVNYALAVEDGSRALIELENVDRLDQVAPNPMSLATARKLRGRVLLMLERLEEASEALTQGEAGFRQLGLAVGTAQCILHGAEVTLHPSRVERLMAEDLTVLRSRLMEALALFEQGQDPLGRGDAEAQLALVSALEGRTNEAEHRLRSVRATYESLSQLNRFRFTAERVNDIFSARGLPRLRWEQGGVS